MNSVYLPHLGVTAKLGRNRPTAKCPRLKLSNYLLKSLPTPPASSDYTSAAQASLSQVYLNDQLGDCVIAGIAHTVGVLTGNASNGNPFLFSQDQIIALYSAIGGYVPGKPRTDQGCDEQTALNYWMQHGAPNGSHQIAGWLSVNPEDPNEYKAAMWLFENLMFGIELPDAWLNNPQPGFVWGPGRPNPNNGHCVVGVGHNSQGIQIATWGMVGTITDAAIQQVVDPKNGGELYVVISQDAINKASQKAPNGLDWSQLVADFDSIGGNITPPAPPTPPVPPVPPTPPAPPTPTPSIQEEVDQAFEFLESTFANVPAIANALKFIQEYIDKVLA